MQIQFIAATKNALNQNENTCSMVK